MKVPIKSLFVLLALLCVGLTASAASFAQDANAVVAPPPTKEVPEGFVSLFDGKTLEGWDGSEKFWSVEDGCITGRSSEDNPVSYSTFLIWKGEPVKDFTLLVDFCISSQGNSGIEYRAWKDDAREHGLNGYQADISPGDIMGILYGEALGEIIAWRGEAAKFDVDGNKTIEKFADAAEIGKSINMHGWNTYRIEARGNKFASYVNDVKTTELVDERGYSPKEGVFGLQMHPGPPMIVQYKNIFLKTR